MSTAIPTSSGPFSEISQSFTMNASGQLVVEWEATPSGDLATVIGIARLTQDLVTWLYMQIGSDITNPTAGNHLFDDIEAPNGADPSIYDEQVNQVILNFKQFQANDAAQGWLSLDEQLDTYDFTCSFTADGLGLQVDIQVTAKSGTSTQVGAALPLG